MNRSVALGAAWSASAIAAVGLGFLAVSLVDASASPGTAPVAATTTASTTPGAPSGTTPIPPATGEYATLAGTVFADCTNGGPALAGAPAAGWWVDDSSKPGELEFKTGTQKLEVNVACVNGSPQFSDEGLRSDDSGRGRGRGGDDASSSASSPASSSSAEATSGRDDSGGDDSSGRGRGRGGDDSGYDDSSGRSGGGHGSDD